MSPTSGPDVRVATAQDIDAIATSLARAFEDDPVWTFLIPDPGRRLKRLFRYFVTAMRLQHIPHSTSYTDSVRAGAALWDPPGHWRMTLSQYVRGGPGFIRSFGGGTVNAVRTLSVVEKRHPAQPHHYYLAVLGTDPDHQGKGIGSSVLKPVLDRCDHDGVGAYLESSKESNIAFYSRLGFEVTGEIRLPGGPLVWPMWRNPREPLG
ncbi:MAG: GNAT family N-acetyltransferase [Acidimicrobiales bacterium]